jgi:acid phosphatase type 7
MIFRWMALLTLSLSLRAADAAPFHPRVTWTVDPATAATVSFDTAADAPLELRYATTPSGGVYDGWGTAVVAQVAGRYLPDGALSYHHCRLTGLSAGTVYYLKARCGAATSAEFHFRSGPKPGRGFSFLQGGDSRTQREIRQGICRLAGTLHEKGLVEFVGFGGDYVATGSQVDLWQEWLEDWQLTNTSDGGLLPIIPAMGNHETYIAEKVATGTQFFHVFDLPEHVYYRVALGDLMSFVTLNTEHPIGGEQARWLGNELAAARALPWVMAQYHRPAFAAIKDPSEAMRAWVPLFERNRVDVVYECDGHDYKVTAPILGGATGHFDTDGVIYLGEGGWGAPQRKQFRDAWWMRAPTHYEARDHVMLITATPEHLRVTGLDGSGARFHELSIPRERAQRLAAFAEPAAKP